MLIISWKNYKKTAGEKAKRDSDITWQFMRARTINKIHNSIVVIEPAFWLAY